MMLPSNSLPFPTWLQDSYHRVAVEVERAKNGGD